MPVHSRGLDLGVGSKVYRHGMTSTATLGRGLRVGELAALVGVSADTVRYFEKASLPPPARTPSGWE